MKDDTPDDTPVEETLHEENVHEEAFHEDELQSLRQFVRQHGRTLTIGLCVAVVAVAVPTAYRSHRNARNRQASLMLSSGDKIQDLEALVEKYPSVPAVALAMLKLAKAYYDNGDYEASLTKYAEFEEEFPDHPMRAAAELGKVHCMEGQRQMEKALLGFISFAEKHPGHFLTPQASFGQGRCLEQMGRLTEAKAVYEDFIAGEANSAWIPRAEELLESVDRELKAAERRSKGTKSQPRAPGETPGPVPADAATDEAEAPDPAPPQTSDADQKADKAPNQPAAD